MSPITPPNPNPIHLLLLQSYSLKLSSGIVSQGYKKINGDFPEQNSYHQIQLFNHP